jgi:hypothetical protein
MINARLTGQFRSRLYKKQVVSGYLLFIFNEINKHLIAVACLIFSDNGRLSFYHYAIGHQVNDIEIRIHNQYIGIETFQYMTFAGKF